MTYPALALLINGQWHTEGRQTLDVLEPATEEVLGRLPMATPGDVEQAIQAAHAAFPSWRRVPALERAGILRQAGAILRSRNGELARLISRELGKPLAESEKEIVTAEMFEWAAEEARRTYGRIIPARAPGIRQMATLEPVGPVAAFSGWNAPAITPSRKIAGALAAGCTVVIKPAEETPAIALEIARALQQAGLPAGVLNMVFGDPGAISAQLLDSPLIRVLTFTGSTSIGRALAERAARSLKRVTLELGGHAPVLVFADADIEAAVAAVSAAKFRNSGQICTSPTRMYVHESLYREFTESLVQRARALRVGNGLDSGVQMGPMANPRRLAAMQSLTEDARAHGAGIASGGERPGGKGWFWPPTVITGFDNDCAAANTEPFGPMALLRPFSTFDEAIAQANRLPFGLASYVFSQRAKTINDATDAIESGVVCVNHCQASLPETPFGGVNDSGLGREGGSEGLREFMQVKYISQI